MENLSSDLVGSHDLGQAFLSFTKETLLLFALIMVYSLVDLKVRDKKHQKTIFIGIVFGGFCGLGMLMPIQITSGFFIDARSVIVLLSAVFGGPVAGFITAVIGGVVRVVLGGDGVFGGILNLVLCLSFGIGYHYLFIFNKIKITFISLFILGSITHISLIVTFLTLPEDLIYSAIYFVWIPMVALFSPMTSLIGIMLRDLNIRREMSLSLKISEANLQGALLRVEEQQGILNEHAIVAETDQAGTITYVNDKFCEIAKYSRDELIGKNHRILKSDIHPPEFFKDFWKVISSGNTWKGDVCNRAKDGSLYWVSSTVMPIYHAENRKITGYISLRTDITENKRTEEALRHSQKMEAVGELTGGIAHDFNNLLGIIVGNHDLMARHVEDGTKLKRLLDKAQKAALRGATLTHRLLGFSRRSVHEVKTLDVNHIIVELEELVRRSLTAKIDLNVKLSEGKWLVDVDSSDFEDALINLAINARDAMPQGGELTIETNDLRLDHPYTSNNGSMDPGDYVEIIVSDTGTGMSETLIEKVFEPFFTTKEQGKGTGLGLSMVYGFVQRSNGFISIYSKEGIGTAIKIFIPKSTNSLSDEQNFQIAEDLPFTGDETILVVDDEVELIAAARIALEEQGYTVIQALTGDEAAKILTENESIELIFTDVLMPGRMSGFDLAEFSQTLGRDIQVLLSSGFMKDMQNSEVGKKWSKSLISKPYRTNDMLRWVRGLLDKNNEENEE